jgi:hypothetical protein
MALASSMWMSAAALRRGTALGLGGFLLVVLLGACGGHAKSKGSPETTGPIEECDAYVAEYAHCLGNLGPERIASARAEKTRVALAAQITEAEGAPARAAIRQKCVTNLSRLTATCEPGHAK